MVSLKIWSITQTWEFSPYLCMSIIQRFALHMVSHRSCMLLSLCFYFFHFLCLCGLIPLFCLQVLIPYLLFDPVYFKGFPLSFLIGLLSFSIPSKC